MWQDGCTSCARAPPPLLQPVTGRAPLGTGSKAHQARSRCILYRLVSEPACYFRATAVRARANPRSHFSALFAVANETLQALRGAEYVGETDMHTILCSGNGAGRL